MVVLATLGSVMIAPSAANAADISMTYYKQEKSNWCWVAASKMIVKQQTGRIISQCEIYKDGKASSACSANNTGSITDVRRALNANGVNPGDSVTLSWNYVTSEVTLNRPIYSRIGWNSGGGHAHVIKGYYNTGYSYGVSYADPATGTSTSREYGNYLSNSSWKQTHTLIHLYRK
ncbi:papain-like cysteine protease family protein [Actinoplanes sp. NPDC023801]|uniref:papain-like cysteine protease family protein n=1 Tax=Actinoplanes sp. NPDC023801 TaxID=3154595 RepID=UPI0033D1E80B